MAKIVNNYYLYYNFDMGRIELEGVFSSPGAIDTYMEWPKGTASRLYNNPKPNDEWIVVNEQDNEEEVDFKIGTILQGNRPSSSKK